MKVTPKIEGASQMQEEAQIALLEQEKKEQELLLHSSFEKNLSNPGRTLAAKPMKKSSATQDSTSEPVIKPSELKKLEFDEDPGAIFRKKNSVAPYRPKELEIGDIEPIRSEMQVIEGGEYERGSNIGARDEKPRHVVRIRSFAIDSYPVTNEQFILFLKVMGGEKDSNNNDMIMLKESRITKNQEGYFIDSGYQKHPVVGVSWYGAKAYAKWVGKRLPTEAEWEIAATNGDKDNMFPTGENITPAEANFFSRDTTAVKSYPSNSNQLYDLAGNVYEWVEDWYGYNYWKSPRKSPMLLRDHIKVFIES